MRVVVDTSVLFAATLRASRVRILFLRPGIEWCAPALAREEFLRHLPRISKAMRLSEVEARRFIETLLKRLVEIPLQKREPNIARRPP